MLLLLEAQEGNWDEIDAMVRAFQGATMALKTSAVPVVVAPAGLTLGGGCEICLHAAHVQAAAETYMGLVEVGVGLMPAGGGTKEMLLRGARPSRLGRSATVRAAGVRDDRLRQGVHERAGCATARLSARRGPHDDEPRAPDRRRQARRARARPRRLRARDAARGRAGRRPRDSTPRSRSACTSPTAPAASATTRSSSAESSRASSPAAMCRTRRRSASRRCSISSAKGF